MVAASSSGLTVRYTVEIEILSSTATQRRYNSSTSGWSAASASTRAMTRRCSVMRMPVAAQRASIPVALSAGADLNTVIQKGRQGIVGLLSIIIPRSAIVRMSRQVAPHQQRIQGFPAALLVIAFAAPDDGKSGAFIKP